MEYTTEESAIRQSFSTALKLARRIHGIDQAEAGRRMGVSARQIGELERQSVSVKAFHVVALYEAMKVSPDLSLGLSVDKEPSIEDVIRSVKRLSGDEDLSQKTYWREFLDALAATETDATS